MAGDWIKFEKATLVKPEVLRMAALLSIHRYQVVGACLAFWSWCDEQLETCHARGVTEKMIDDIIGVTGFASALLEVGWLHSRNGSIEVPNFDRHLSESAKTRSLSGKRKAKQRHADVTKMSRSERDKSVTREEKRREETNQSAAHSAAGGGRRKKSPAKSDPEPEKTKTDPHSVAIAAFCDRWAKRYGTKYPFAGAKDGDAVRWMLSQVDGDPAKLTPVFDRFIADDSGFHAAEDRHSLTKLRQHFTRWYVPTESPGVANGNGTTVRGPAGAAPTATARRSSGTITQADIDTLNARTIRTGTPEPDATKPEDPAAQDPEDPFGLKEGPAGDQSGLSW